MMSLPHARIDKHGVCRCGHPSCPVRFGEVVERVHRSRNPITRRYLMIDRGWRPGNDDRQGLILELDGYNRKRFERERQRGNLGNWRAKSPAKKRRDGLPVQRDVDLSKIGAIECPLHGPQQVNARRLGVRTLYIAEHALS